LSVTVAAATAAGSEAQASLSGLTSSSSDYWPESRSYTQICLSHNHSAFTKKIPNNLLEGEDLSTLVPWAVFKKMMFMLNPDPLLILRLSFLIYTIHRWIAQNRSIYPRHGIASVPDSETQSHYILVYIPNQVSIKTGHELYMGYPICIPCIEVSNEGAE
jgi:hypothetical protein